MLDQTDITGGTATQATKEPEWVLGSGSKQPSLKDEKNGQLQKDSTGINLMDWRWLADLSPGFPLHGSQIKILTTPQEFYSTLVHKMESATRRISLASLYLGTGALEEKLVEIMKSQLSKNPDLKIKVLLDYTRGSRGSERNSRTMLTPLIKQDTNSCEVYLYHTPALRGAVKRWLPPRWNEVIGVQHMKIYIFDDSIVISGANLSNDYFTNRQDRYVLLENAPDLANFFDKLITEVAKFSFKLDSSNLAHLHPEWPVHPSEGNPSEFVNLAKSRIVTHYENYQKNNQHILSDFYQNERSSSRSRTDTWVFPVVQMGQLKIDYDNQATSKILADSPPNSTITLSTGYFNLTSDYIDQIVNKSASNFQILMAHPKANGFYGAQGFAHGIPSGYTLMAKNFFEKLKSSQQISRISMWEYLRTSWTFHAKGLWYYPPGERLPQVTLIGSPNFGHRSVYRDLEMQLYVITKNLQLRQELENEQKVLFEESKPFNDVVLRQTERRIPTWVRLVMRYFKDLF